MMKNKGYTLLELMIALGVFSLLTLVTMRALMELLQIHQYQEKKLTQLVEWRRAHQTMMHDFSLVAPWHATLEGNSYPNFETATPMPHDSTDLQMITHFTRLGHTALGNHPHTRLKHIGYGVEDHALVRLIWSDSTEQVASRPMLQHVETITVDYFHQGQWVHALTETEQQDVNKQVIPQAVRFRIQHTEWGEFEWLFATPALYRLT